jgi:hypothetical protein
LTKRYDFRNLIKKSPFLYHLLLKIRLSIKKPMPSNRKMTITFTFNGKPDKRNLQCGTGIGEVVCVKKKKRSEKQCGHLSKFEKAKEYGRQVVADPVKTAHYMIYRKKWKRKLKHTGIYQLAIMDFMNPPAIHEARVNEEFGNSEKLILVKVRGKFEISHVSVSMIAPDGKILETGEIYQQNTLGFYIYALNTSASLKAGVICRICVHDFPGNIIEKDFCFFD